MRKILWFLLACSSAWACEHGDIISQEVLDPDGRRMNADIDRCLSPIVQALNDAGIATVSSCCNHHKTEWGYILLDDRLILISQQTDRLKAYDLYLELCEANARYWDDIRKAKE